jgi:hypothetical protein
MNRLRVVYWIVGMILGTAIAVEVQGQTTVTCPPAPDQVVVKVASNVTFDAVTKMYTYSYVVSNDPSSAQEVDSFSLDFAPPASNFTNPHGWVHSTFPQRSTLGWDAIAPPGTHTSAGVAVPPAASQIKPGQSVAGFSFQSPKPPGPVRYYVTGYVGVPVQADELAAETLVEECPQSFGPILDRAIVGSTQGPVNFIPVQIEIKPPSTPPVSINPRSQGVTPVAILGTATFQVSSVDPSSLRLGPGGSTPLPNQVHFEDVNGDGIIDLVAQFPTQKIGARCNDTALFLTGKTTDGTPIQGSEATHTVGCK